MKNNNVTKQDIKEIVQASRDDIMQTMQSTVQASRDDIMQVVLDINDKVDGLRGEFNNFTIETKDRFDHHDYLLKNILEDLDAVLPNHETRISKLERVS